MTYPAIPVKFVEIVGYRRVFRCWLETDIPCTEGSTDHLYRKVIDQSEEMKDNFDGVEFDDFAPPANCECSHCGKTIPYYFDYNNRSFGTQRVWSTESGELEPGCMYWNTWTPSRFYWKDTDFPLLSVVLANGSHWIIDSRASNCDMKEDHTHRCWVRHGEPPNITVDKQGHTCNAGGGSIWVGDYHGFLRNGVLTEG